MTWFPGALTWRRREALAWRRSEAPLCRRTQRTRRRGRRRRVCGGKMTWLGFRGLGILKKKNSCDEHDDVINVVATYELSTSVAIVVMPVTTVAMPVATYLKNRV
jgi:hypothetical protein